jgi:hypothetical protein
MYDIKRESSDDFVDSQILKQDEYIVLLVPEDAIFPQVSHVFILNSISILLINSW